MAYYADSLTIRFLLCPRDRLSAGTGNVNSEFGWRYTTISDLMINDQIRDREVRLVGEDGEQLGIMSARDAYLKAQEAGLDLVKIAPMAKPPVCKIIDYGNSDMRRPGKKRKHGRSRRLWKSRKCAYLPTLIPMI